MTVAASGSPADDDEARCIDVDMHDDPELVPMTDELSDLGCSGQIAHLRVTLEPERDGAKRVHGVGIPARTMTKHWATVSELLTTAELAETLALSTSTVLTGSRPTSSPAAGSGESSASARAMCSTGSRRQARRACPERTPASVRSEEFAP